MIIFEKESNKNAIGSLRCVSSFNTYHYTVYIPKNAGVDALVKNRVLIMPKELDAIDEQYDQMKEDIQGRIGASSAFDARVLAEFKDSLLNLCEKAPA